MFKSTEQLWQPLVPAVKYNINILHKGINIHEHYCRWKNMH